MALLLSNALSFYAQNSLLERIPTHEFAVVSFDGKSINEKSKNVYNLPMFDSINNQFNTLLIEYSQYLKDENTVLTTEEVEEQIQELDAESNSASEYENQYYSDDYYANTPSISLASLYPYLTSNGFNYGINNTANYYYLVGVSDTINHYALLFNKNDETKFQSLIHKLVPDDLTSKYIHLANGYQYFLNDDDKMIIAWNNTTVAFIEYSIPYNYYDIYSIEEEPAHDDDYYESYEDRLKAEAEAKEAKKRAKVEALINQFFIAKPELSLKFNTEYQTTLLKKADVSYFMSNSGQQNGSFSKIFKDSYQNSSQLLNLFKDNYSYGYLDFNPSSIDLNLIQHVGNYYLKEAKEMNKIKFNKAMYKYIDGENLQAIVGFAANPEPVYNMTKDIYIDVLSNMKFGRDWYGTLADIAYTFFDEKELFDLIKGDFVFAITDIKEFETEYTAYDYDEDYNRIEVQKTKKETLPEFVSMATIGNESLRNKIIKFMQQTDVIVKKGHYYELQEPASKWDENSKAKPLSVFYMLKDDLLVVTKDEALLVENNGNGLAKAKRMGKKPTKLMKKNNMFAYWLPKKPVEKIPNEFLDFNEMFTQNANSFEAFEIQGVKNKKNLFTSSAKIILNVDKQESLQFSLKLINDILKASWR